MATKQFLNEAFKLVESSNEDIITDDELEIEPIEDAEEVPIESEEEEETEPTIDELEDRIEKLEDTVYNVDSYEEDEPDNRGPLEKTSDEFNSNIEKELRRVSNLSDDIEITEELLDKHVYQKAYIPHVAVRYHTTSDNVRNILLGR